MCDPVLERTENRKAFEESVEGTREFCKRHRTRERLFPHQESLLDREPYMPYFGYAYHQILKSCFLFDFSFLRLTFNLQASKLGQALTLSYQVPGNAIVPNILFYRLQVGTGMINLKSSKDIVFQVRLIRPLIHVHIPLEVFYEMQFGMHRKEFVNMGGVRAYFLNY